MNKEELNEFLYKAFPEFLYFGTVQDIKDDKIIFSLKPTTFHIRPGGTISGPTMMMMVDTASWCSVLNKIGPEAMAVTTNLNINFLRKPTADAPLNAISSLLKLGKRLAICEVRIEQKNILVAHGTCTYSIPPETKDLRPLTKRSPICSDR